jgi:hypothetical protein
VAIFKPSLAEVGQLLTPLNDGELRVAHALSALDDDWTIYVQPHLGMDWPDFVAVHDRHGVCAIEVKDWAYDKYRLSDNGTAEFRNGGGGWTSTDENPRYQAYRYRSTIFEQFFAMPEDGTAVPPSVRAIVVLLNHSTEHARRVLHSRHAPSAQRAIDIRGEDALAELDDLLRGDAPSVPRRESMQRLRRHLAESSVAWELRQPIPMSEGAGNIESNPNNARRRRVRGPAGCGKSFGLAARAARLASDGKNVLVLSFNVTLSHYLRALVASHCATYAANPARVTCVPIHAFSGRVVEDAKAQGIEPVDVGKVAPWDEAIAKAASVLAQGYQCRYDAVLVDEGQDFELAWWQMLRDHVVTPDGEMLLVADPTQDIFNKQAWTDEERMIGSGFSGQWTDLAGSYRMPSDMVPIANAFAEKYLGGARLAAAVPADRFEISGTTARTGRRWDNISPTADLGYEVGLQTVALLRAHPELCPSDVVFMCETHPQGMEAVKVIEANGYAVHHMFGMTKSEKQRRKRRFWPDAPGVRGCTVDSFKGWESRAVVLGIGTWEGRSPRLAYVAMTRVKGDALGRPSLVTVVNSDPALAAFEGAFAEAAESWPAPLAELRVG